MIVSRIRFNARRIPRRAIAAAVLGCICWCGGPARVSAQTTPNPAWEAAIAKFEAADAGTPFAKQGVVFVGSSSIRLWNLAESFPDRPLLNRGFGGSHLADSVTYVDRLVIKHAPRLVLLYAGDNDLAAGKSAETVCGDFQAFVSRVHAALPETQIAYLAIKPSPLRWKLIEAQRDANRRIAEVIAKDARLVYVDTATALLGPDGQPVREYYVADGLHLSLAGYARWAQLVLPLLP